MYEVTKDNIGFDMTKPVKLKGRDGEQRALRPFGKKVGHVRHKADENLTSAIFVGRKVEMQKLHEAASDLMNNGKGSAFILEGLGGNFLLKLCFFTSIIFFLSFLGLLILFHTFFVHFLCCSQLY